MVKHRAEKPRGSPPKKQRPSAFAEGLLKSRTDYLLPRMASLQALATRNFTTRLAGIWICSPVAGLRPRRALRLTNTSLPMPGRVKVFLAFLYASWAMISRISAACFFLRPALSAISAATWDLDNAFAIIVLLVIWFSCVLKSHSTGAN